MQPQKTNFLRHVDLVIERNLQNEFFSTDELAAAVFLCRMQLYRRMKKETGISASQYIRKYRLERAAELLMNSNLSIADIGWEMGFSWPAYFTRCFKDYFGLCPGAFRGNFGNLVLKTKAS